MVSGSRIIAIINSIDIVLTNRKFMCFYLDSGQWPIKYTDGPSIKRTTVCMMI